MSNETGRAMTETECLAVKTVYEELCRAHDGIADFRAKLLALLPLASGAGIVALTRMQESEKTEHFLAIGIFGALVGAALYIYEIRGMHRCFELAGRAAELEKALGCECYPGVFLNTPMPRLFFLSNAMAAAVIYSATIALWVYMAFCGLSDTLEELEQLKLPRVLVSIAICVIIGIAGSRFSKPKWSTREKK